MRSGNPIAAAMMRQQAAGALEPKTPALTPSGEDPEAIRDAARQFESVFLHQVFKTMRSTVPKGGLVDSGFGGEVFTDMLDQQYAEIASANGQVGLAGIIAAQLGAPMQETYRPAAAQGHRLRAAQAYADRARVDDPMSGGWIAPVDGRVSSAFGPRKLADEEHARQHHGLDIAAPTGTPIRAARAGVVAFAGPRGGYGNTIEIDHGDGLSTLYAHASAIDVEEGDRVRAGKPIGAVGSTGRSTGPHLHFEIRRDGEPVDPASVLRIGD